MKYQKIALLPFILLPMVAPKAKANEACLATLTASFTESAPRDYFRFKHVSESGWSVSKITLSLDTSAGNLIFDTNDGGMGVEVFQPFRNESTTTSTAEVSLPDDGGQKIELTFNDFSAGADYSFSIDVDDQLTQSKLGNIRVAGSEMSGATLQVEFSGPDGGRKVETSVFDADSQAVVASGC